jgi:TPR repeat protein
MTTEARLQKLRNAAEQGHAVAQFNLGYACDNGEGVPEDKAEAVKWFRLAAEQGFADAQFNLGYAYDFGKGVLP